MSYKNSPKKLSKKLNWMESLHKRLVYKRSVDLDFCLLFDNEGLRPAPSVRSRIPSLTNGLTNDLAEGVVRSGTPSPNFS